MHVDHVNQMLVEESKLLLKLSPVLIICALSLGKHTILLFRRLFVRLIISTGIVFITIVRACHVLLSVLTDVLSIESIVLSDWPYYL